VFRVDCVKTSKMKVGGDGSIDVVRDYRIASAELGTRFPLVFVNGPRESTLRFNDTSSFDVRSMRPDQSTNVLSLAQASFRHVPESAVSSTVGQVRVRREGDDYCHIRTSR